MLVIALVALMILCVNPQIFSYLIMLFILWCIGHMLCNWLFGGLGRHVPPVLRNIPRQQYGRRLAGHAWHHSYRKQAERRGRVFGLWHLLLVVTIVFTLNWAFSLIPAGTTITIPIFLWPTTIALFLIWRWWRKNFAGARPQPGRQRR